MNSSALWLGCVIELLLARRATNRRVRQARRDWRWKKVDGFSMNEMDSVTGLMRLLTFTTIMPINPWQCDVSHLTDCHCQWPIGLTSEILFIRSSSLVYLECIACFACSSQWHTTCDSIFSAIKKRSSDVIHSLQSISSVICVYNTDFVLWIMICADEIQANLSKCLRFARQRKTV